MWFLVNLCLFKSLALMYIPIGFFSPFHWSRASSANVFFINSVLFSRFCRLVCKLSFLDEMVSVCVLPICVI